MKKIFRERGQAIFDPSYLPKSLPHRQEQYNMLKKTLIDEINGKEFGIPILFGTSGTGKTTVLRKVLNNIEQELSENIECEHINATTLSKTYTAIQRISSKIISIPERGYGMDEIILKLYDRLDIQELKYIIGIDDADELIRREHGKIIDILTRVEESYSKRLIYPVIVLRNINMLRGLSPHITSKLGGVRIEFLPYNKKQLKDILSERIRYGLVENAISKNAVDAAAFATEKIFIGNARELMNIILKAGKTAEAMDEEKIVAEHIRFALYDIYTKTAETYLSKHEEEKYYKVLWAMSKVISEKTDTYRLDIDILQEAYEVYKRNFMNDLSYEVFAETISELSKTSHDIISQDYGNLVFLTYPAKKLYEKLTEKLFL